MDMRNMYVVLYSMVIYYYSCTYVHITLLNRNIFYENLTRKVVFTANITIFFSTGILFGRLKKRYLLLAFGVCDFLYQLC